MRTNNSQPILTSRAMRCCCARHSFLIGYLAFVALQVSALLLMTQVSMATERSPAPNNPSQDDEGPTREGIAFFETKIRPVLVEHCYSCHAADSSQLRGGLMLDSREGTRVGGTSGPAVVPGSLDESLLWESITYSGLEMPPGAPLSDEVIEDFRRWIEMGAPDPRHGQEIPVRSKVTPEEIAEGRKSWSFQPPTNPSIPSVQNVTWQRQDLDRFVLARLEEADMKPASDAEPLTLLRRLNFDLIGLPPTREQIGRFLKTWQQDEDLAIKRAVDELLELPQFGERWGRHWLDLARYAETAGKEVNATFPNAWRYRDYVIDSFNEDKPYDRFLQEQIAGDLLPVDSDEQWAENLIATGFLALGPKTLTDRNRLQFTADLVDEQIDTVSRVVLGVSVACARCHDHKFDPIPQSDYYALSGIFQSTRTYYGTIPSLQNRQASDLIILPIDDPNPADKGMSEEQIVRLKQQIQTTQSELNELRIEYRQSRTRSNGQSRSDQDSIRATFAKIRQQSQRLSLMRDRLRSVDGDGKPRSFAMGVQPAEQPVRSRVLVRGELTQPAQAMDHGFVHVIDPDFGSVTTSTDSRLDLAEWMTRPTNPLTARVMVNRIWQHLIGEGIVASTEDFGASGDAPSHPMLLDHLAMEFIDSGWSIKSMIQKIATSRTYRMSTEFQAQYFQLDPDNRLIWRANSRRLDAEEIRDAMLAVSGNLDLERPRASSVAQQLLPIAFEGMQMDSVPQRRFGQQDRIRQRGMNRRAMPQDSQTRPRSGNGPRRFRDARFARRENEFATSRSVYLAVVRDIVPESLELFDFAEPSMVIGKRDSSTTPSQALYLLNDEFVIQQSDALSRKILRQADNPEGMVKLAFEMVYGRPARTTELKMVERFIREGRQEPRSRRQPTNPNANQLSLLCQALFASAEFRYLE